MAAEIEAGRVPAARSTKKGGLATPSSSPKTHVKRPSPDVKPPARLRPKRRAAQNVKYEVESSGETDDELMKGFSSDDEYKPAELIKAGVEQDDKVKEEMTPEMEDIENGDRVSSEIKALGRELQVRTTTPVKVEI